MINFLFGRIRNCHWKNCETATSHNIHLAGHSVDNSIESEPLLIDAHDREVIGDVWSLYSRAIERAGPRPTLIEWDNEVPDWPTLFAETAPAKTILDAAHANTQPVDQTDQATNLVRSKNEIA